jgi:5-methylcytosine-specific restriction endonuclease McrA
MVKIAVARRDGGVCQLCHLDINAAYTAWRKSEPDRWAQGEGFLLWRKWSRSEPKPEYDHIIPFCEGGLTVLENMRTLCVPCHKKVTKEFRKRRAKEKAAAKHPELPLQNKTGIGEPQ